MGGVDSVWYGHTLLVVVAWDVDCLLIGLVTTMIAAGGTLFNVSKRAQNQGKVRYRAEAWCIFN